MFHAKYNEVLVVLEIYRNNNSLEVLFNIRYEFVKDAEFKPNK